MSDRIDMGGASWDAIPRSILRNPNLSPRAKGGLVTLLSHDDGWVRSCIGILQSECDCGREQAKAIMGELRTAGYATLVTAKDAGKFSSSYIVRAIPEPTSSGPGTSRSQGTVSQATAIQATVTPPREVEPLDVQPLDVHPLDVRTQEPPRSKVAGRYTLEFEAFWEAYPIHKDKGHAFEAFKKALKRATLEELLEGAKFYAADPGRDPEKTKWAQGWLTGDRWLDEPVLVGAATAPEVPAGWAPLSEDE